MLQELAYLGPAAGSAGPIPPCVHAPGLPRAGPSSHRDPQHTPAYASGLDRRPLQDAAFDRFYSLVEVCAAARSPRTAPPSQPPNIALPVAHPLSHMVRAPPFDADAALSAAAYHIASPTLPRTRRRHACKMCDKAFDRPSTLKTHLLVHTGITPFACHLCGRRFGVQSNCNRHIRRCTLRSELFLARRIEFEAAQHGGHPRAPAAAHHRAEPPPRSESRSPSPPKPKRARRKRSPAAAWVPQSLASFKLSSAYAPAPVPLPPVRPSTTQEERDSYIVCHDQPYTEEGWSGRLPGPAPLYDSMTKTLSNLLMTSR